MNWKDYLACLQEMVHLMIANKAKTWRRNTYFTSDVRDMRALKSFAGNLLISFEVVRVLQIA